MKIARFEKDGEISFGLIEGKKIKAANGTLSDLKPTGKVYDLDSVRLLSPVTPSKIVAAGLNYKDHVGEMKDDIPPNPIIFIKPSTSVIGHLDTIVCPVASERVDYEGELAVVIKKTAKNIKAADASDYILGYTCLNDVTARDLQKKDGQWTRAKGFDTFCPIGPYIVTGINPQNLDIRTYLDGKTVQSANTAQMLFPIPEIFEFVTSVMTLNEGDVIATGTPSGIGKMEKGQKVEIEIENIGRLINFVG